jgi:hypothetical protein
MFRYSSSRGARRGSALILTLLLTAALGALAMSAIFLSSNAQMLSRVSDREADLRTAADAAIQVGRNMIAYAPDTLPATGFAEISLPGGTVNGADGKPMKNVTVKLWVGPTGSPTNSNAGSFASIVADAQDERGGHAVRRLEVLRESFARFAYFSNFETAPGSSSPIYFTCGDIIQGPLFSNSTLNLNPSCTGTKPTFMQDVSTAGSIQTVGDGDFRSTYKEGVKSITMPSTSQVSYLKTRATAGGMAFVANVGGTALRPTMRIEFVSVAVDKVPTTPDVEAKGFLRVFKLPANPSVRQLDLLRASFNKSKPWNEQTFCGDFHTIGGIKQFFPISQHVSRPLVTTQAQLYMATYISDVAKYNGNVTEYNASMAQFRADTIGTGTNSAADIQAIMSNTGARCYPAGAPELWLTEWWPKLPTAADQMAQYHGGTPWTYLPDQVAKESGGSWQPMPATYIPSGRVLQRRQIVADSTVPGFTAANPGTDARYLVPLDPDYNSASKRVIDVTGNTAISGTVRGFYTLHVAGTMLIIDDLRYFTTPGAAGASAPSDASNCHDILGVVSDADIVIADNGIMTPQQIFNGSSAFRSLGSADGSPDATVHGIMMTLGTSWTVENYSTASTTNPALTCGTTDASRGCLFLVGGLIQVNRGIVGTGAGNTGYIKKYNYDICAVLTPPPFFPTTGVFKNNRYVEIDPANFDIAALFDALDPNK